MHSKVPMKPFLLPSFALALSLLSGAVTAQQMKLPRSVAPSPASTVQAPAATAEAPAGAAEPSATAQKEAAAKLAAGGWLILLDRGDWGRSWETASAVFRSSVPLPAWMDGIPKAREPFGRMLDRKPVEAVYKTTLAGRPPGEYVTVIFETQFENKKVEEVVTTELETDGSWRATGYSTR
jgi:hypothetical protein